MNATATARARKAGEKVSPTLESEPPHKQRTREASQARIIEALRDAQENAGIFDFEKSYAAYALQLVRKGASCLDVATDSDNDEWDEELLAMRAGLFGALAMAPSDSQPEAFKAALELAITAVEAEMVDPVTPARLTLTAISERHSSENEAASSRDTMPSDASWREMRALTLDVCYAVEPLLNMVHLQLGRTPNFTGINQLLHRLNSLNKVLLDACEDERSLGELHKDVHGPFGDSFEDTFGEVSA